MKSNWVTTEWGAAWALGLKIVPILLRVSVEEIEHIRLRNPLSIEYSEEGLKKYAENVAKRKLNQWYR